MLEGEPFFQLHYFYLEFGVSHNHAVRELILFFQKGDRMIFTADGLHNNLMK